MDRDELQIERQHAMPIHKSKLFHSILQKLQIENRSFYISSSSSTSTSTSSSLLCSIIKFDSICKTNRQTTKNKNKNRYFKILKKETCTLFDVSSWNSSGMSNRINAVAVVDVKTWHRRAAIVNIACESAVKVVATTSSRIGTDAASKIGSKTDDNIKEWNITTTKKQPKK